MRPPNKPFDGYKWIWASYVPTESLNDPVVFLGVLRALRTCEGMKKSSQELFQALRRVEKNIEAGGPTVNLARQGQRNLIRNSGQYWQATGLLVKRQGIIELSDFGRRVADGEIARREFGLHVVDSLCLPNRRIRRDWTKWDEAGLVIRPLKLILSILAELRVSGSANNWLSVDELIKIVIPLAGSSASVDTHCEAIRLNRAGQLDLSQWPDCVPAANDRRMAREFLLFLEYHAFVERVQHGYALVDADHGLELGITPQIANGGAGNLFTTRPKRLVGMRARPGQPLFRRRVLEKHGARCLLTGERIPDVLEAAHIIPVRYNGSDDASNGLCLRTDVHALFDSGHIRIKESGQIKLSTTVEASPNYARLPREVDIPAFVRRPALRWRWWWL